MWGNCFSAKISKTSFSCFFVGIFNFLLLLLVWYFGTNANGIKWVYPSSGVPFSTKGYRSIIANLGHLDDQERKRKRNVEHLEHVEHMIWQLQETQELQVEFSSSILTIAWRYTAIFAWVTPSLMHSYIWLQVIVFLGPYGFTWVGALSQHNCALAYYQSRLHLFWPYLICCCQWELGPRHVRWARPH